MPWNVPDLWGEELLEVALKRGHEEPKGKNRNSKEGLGEGHRLTGTLPHSQWEEGFGGKGCFCTFWETGQK